MDGFLQDTEVDLNQYYSEGWKYGPPRGILFHAGAVLRNSGASVHFSITREGQITQHVSLSNRSWHAAEASDYYFSIFHFVDDIMDPDYTLEQLRASAFVSAEIIRFTKEKLGMLIPVARAPGKSFSPGFKEHKDGLGAPWNSLFHKEGLVSTWSWPDYLTAVKNELEEDDMALFDSKEDFRKETLKALVGADANGEPRIDSDRLVDSLSFTAGIAYKMKGGERPEKVDAFQKGWDFANHILSLDPESLGLEFPNGKLSGTITFS